MFANIIRDSDSSIDSQNAFKIFTFLLKINNFQTLINNSCICRESFGPLSLYYIHSCSLIALSLYPIHFIHYIAFIELHLG